MPLVLRLVDLSVRNPPLGEWLMAVLMYKFYADNSGEAEDPQHKASSVAGFVATADNWKLFEQRWQQNVLDRFELDYMHMNEFKGYAGKFAKFKGNRHEEIALFQAVCRAIRDSYLTPIGSSLRLADLRRFNQKHDQTLDDFAFNAHVCAQLMKLLYGENLIETFFDRTNGVLRKLDLAEQYAESDPDCPGILDTIQLNALGKGETFRKVLPIQAADFLAWELRRDMGDKDEWYGNFEADAKSKDYKNALAHMGRWAKANGKRLPFHRQSLGTLARSTFPRLLTWTYDSFCSVHERRHGIWDGQPARKRGQSPLGRRSRRSS
jgi:hypothetical protein